jgi:type II secretory pathway pseudopilin PulG
MRRRLTSQRGLSLIEVTIMVSVLSTLTAVMSPTIGDYVEDARRVKASGDVQVLASTFARFAYDVPGNPTLDRGWAAAELLVGPGDVPATAGSTESVWTASVDGRRVARIEDHLMVNTPGYPARTEGPHFTAGGWRGAYLSALTTDPWGRRYAINVGGFAGGEAQTVVLSAGPNGLVETRLDNHGVQAGGDDIVAVIGGGR